MNLTAPINLYLDSIDMPISKIENILQTRDTRAVEFLFMQFLCENQTYFQQVMFDVLHNYLFIKKLQISYTPSISTL